MDDDAELGRLPQPYADALKLWKAGRREEIATRLGIPSESVTPLLSIALAKLSRAVAESPSAPPTTCD